MYYRDQQATVLRLFTKFQVVGIIGPRQSGKTTLATTCFPSLPYVSFENYDQQRMAIDDPRGLLALYKDGAIFDEVQHVPRLLSYMQEVVDKNDKPGQFVITGSQNFSLSNEMTQSLAGRIGIVTLLPLSQKELKQEGPWYELAFKGGYPRVHKYHIDPQDFYASYLNTYVEKDIRRLLTINDLAAFKNFIALCAGRSGQLLNVLDLSRDAGVSQSTALRWLGVLQATYIIFLINPYHKNFSKRIAKQSKLYFYDTGLLCNLLGIDSPGQLRVHSQKGAIFENLIFTEVLKYRFNQGRSVQLYFWHDRVSKAEVDLVAEWNDYVYALEIKSGHTFHADWLAGLKIFKNEIARVKAGVIYNGPLMGITSDCLLISYEKLEDLFVFLS